MNPNQISPAPRQSGDLLQPVLENPLEKAPIGLPLDESRGVQGMNTARQDAEGALHFLTSASAKPAVLLARAWHVLGIPFAFEHMNLYDEVARASQCTIVTVVRPEAGGQEHLVFAARVSGLTDEQCLACISDSATAPSGQVTA